MIGDTAFIGREIQRQDENLNAFVPSRQWEIVTVAFENANEDTEVLHSLVVADPKQIRYQVLQASAPVVVFHDPMSDWGAGIIKLRCTSDDVTVHLLLTIGDTSVGELPLAQDVSFVLPGTSGDASLYTLGVDSTALDSITGPALDLNSPSSHWRIGTRATTARAGLQFVDEINGYTPFSVRYNASSGIYEVMPGPNTSSMVDTDIGSIAESFNLGRFRAAYLTEGIGTFGRETHDGVWDTYTPTWGNTAVSQPSIGDGSLTGSFAKFGKTVKCKILLVVGASTTFGGAGGFFFSLPSTANFHLQGSVILLDSGVGYYQGVPFERSSTEIYVLAGPEPISGAIGPTVPFTFAPGDVVSIVVEYSE